MPRIDPQRLLASLARLSAFGAYRTGTHRPTYSEPDMAARHWLAGEFEAIGLGAAIDGVGNVFGRARGDGPALLVGSHAESQNHAGRLDGALGVVVALEAARAFAEDKACRGLAVEPVAFADEESHYLAMLGSRSFVGLIGESDLDRAADHTSGTPLRAALAAAGLAGRVRETVPPGRYVGYLECHIEQGDVLDRAGERLGIVTGIVGYSQYRILVTGEANHAGTTRMAARRDAGAAAIALATAIHSRFPLVAGPDSVWTIGRLVFRPGQPSIVPGEAEMLLQFRDERAERLAALDAALAQIVAEAEAAGPCAIALTLLSRTTPCPMAPGFQDALEAAAARHAPAGSYRRMPSFAGHDAQQIARVMPAGMLFVPSIGGISHHWSEDTRDEDIVLGAQVFADAAESILRRARASGAGA